MKRFLWMLALCGTALAAGRAWAGVYLVSEMRDGSSSPVVSRTSIGLMMARLEVKGATGYNAVIYRGDRQLFWKIDDSHKVYWEMTTAGVNHMTTQLQNIQPQLAQAMKNMTTDQKAALYQYMPSETTMGSIMSQSGRKYVKKAVGERVGKWKADRYECLGSGGELRRLWTVPKEDLNLTGQDLWALRALSGYVARFGGNRSDFYDFDGSALGFTGIPVKAEVVRAGKTLVVEMKKAKKKNLDPSLFEIPSGYQKKLLPSI